MHLLDTSSNLFDVVARIKKQIIKLAQDGPSTASFFSFPFQSIWFSVHQEQGKMWCDLKEELCIVEEFGDAHEKGDLEIKTPKGIVFRSEEVSLPNGSKVLYEAFSTHPLFKHTSGKKEVFNTLRLFCMGVEEYNSFLEDLKQEKWFEKYTDDPKKLAYLSLMAFLEEKIDQDELFVIHTLAEACAEKIANLKVSKVSFFILSKNMAADYLRENNFLPFAGDVKIPLLFNRKSKRILKNQRRQFLGRLNRLSSIKRTTIEYEILPNAEEVEKNLYDVSKKIGFKRKAMLDGTVTAVLLPIAMAIELLRRTSNIPARQPKEHVYLFGASSDNKALFEGVRIIHIPSPILKFLPEGEPQEKPASLSLLFREINYRMVLEVDTPSYYT